MKLTLKPHQSIQQALDQIPLNEPVELYLSAGTYTEKLRIQHKRIAIYGSLEGKTVISNGDYAYKMHEDGLLYNTFRTFTIMFLSDDVKLYNLTIENTCGSGFTIGQGVALSLNSKQSYLENCQLIGHQDTLFVGPLPRDLNERYDHFLALEERGDQITHHHFKSCLIQGDVDFIFGSGISLFDQCHIQATAKGYIAAPSTYQEFPYGFVFYQSLIDNVSQDQVYLARPWREHGACTFIDSTFKGKFEDMRYDAWDKSVFRFKESPYVSAPLSEALSQEEREQLFCYLKLNMPSFPGNDYNPK